MGQSSKFSTCLKKLHNLKKLVNQCNSAHSDVVDFVHVVSVSIAMVTIN